MAQPKTANGEQLYIQIGNGGSPETFTHPCLINLTRSISFDAEVTQTAILDCSAADSPGWKSADIDGLAVTIEGEGVFDLDFQDDLFDWWKSGLAKNCKVVDAATGANGGQTFSGAFKLTKWAKSGGRKSRLTGSLTLMSDGAVTRSANA